MCDHLNKNFLIDVTRLVRCMLEKKLPTGIDRVGLAYVDHYQNRAQALVRFGGRWLVLNRVDSLQLFNVLLSRNASCVQSRIIMRCALVKKFILAWKKIPRNAILLNVVHSGLEDLRYIRKISHYGLQAFFTLHDLIPITHPEYQRAGEAGRHRERVKSVLSCTGIFFDSLEVRQTLESYIKGTGLVIPPSIVAPLAPANLPPPSMQAPFTEPYFVVLGTIEARKNHILLLHIWRQLVTMLGVKTPKLVIVGKRGWECEQVIDLLDRCESLQGSVIEMKYCGDDDLATLLHHARALLFPSFAEGFGMPLVEALSFGLPVLASDLPVFREIAGDIPEYFDPLDGPSWRDAILDYAQKESPRAAAQKERIKNYNPSTWKNHFSIVDSFIESCSKSAQSD